MPIRIEKHGGLGKHGINSSLYHTGLSGTLTDNFLSIDENGLPQDSGYGIETVLSGTPNKIADSQAIKTYVDDLIPRLDALVYKGVIDCSINPNYPSADCGWLYKISEAGRIGGSSGKIVEVNDIALCTQDGTPSGDEATVGSYWDVIQSNTDRVLISPEASINNRIIVYSGTTGLIAHDSGYLAQDASISQKGFIQLSNSSSGTLENVAVTEKALTDGDKLKTAGPVSIPTFTDNGNGTATIGSCTANIYPSTDFSGILKEYSLSTQTLTFIDGNEEYVVVDYNLGSPIIRKETNKYLINGSNVFTLFIVWRQGTVLHSIDNGSYGLGLSSKTYRMLYNTESYRRSVDKGLILSELPSRNIKVTGSIVYAGSTPTSVTEYNSSSGDLLTQAFTSGSAWYYNNVLSYDNTHYDTGSGILLLEDNKWSNRFFYRSIGDIKEVFYTLGQEQFFNHDRCLDELPPEPPTLLRDHCLYIGRTIIEENATSGTAHPIFDYIESEPEYSFYRSAGIWDSPTITTGTNTITVGTGSYILFDDSNYENNSLDKYKITGQTFTIANDQATHYIVAKYNNGTPIITQTSDVNEINQSDVIPILTCFNLEGQILYLFWDNFAKGLANKLCHRFVKTDRFKVQPGGLILSEKATRYVTITSGVIWYGATYSELSSIDSSVAGNEIALWYHVGGTLTRFTTTQYDNTYYDNGTDRVELNPNRYAVNWVYRGVSQLNNRPVILLGGGNYVLADAIASNPPSDLPAVTANFGKLVGRIIVKKGDSIATQIDSLQADTGISPLVSNHNGLAGLQGGTYDEYYHLTLLEHTNAIQVASGSQSGILSSIDWNTFNDKQDALTSGSLLGTANQVIVTGGVNSLIGSGALLSLPQDIAVTSSPTFSKVTLSSTPALDSDATTKNYVDTEDAVIPLITHEPTGFESRSFSSMSFNSGSLAFTITPSGSASFNIWSQGVKYEKEECTTTIDNTQGLWYVYFDTSGTLQHTQTVWNFVDGNAPVATVYWDGSAGLVCDERHGIIMDGMTHGWAHYTIGVRYGSGLTGTFNDTSFSITSGIIYDEDIRFVIGTQTQCRVFYRDSGFYKFTSPQAKWFTEVSNVLQYDNAGVLADVDNNKYMAMWIFAVNDKDYPIYALVGQRQDTLLADARANNKYESLSLLTLPSQEMKLLYRVIVRRNGTSEVYTETQDLRSVSNLPAGTYVATAHNLLTGLTTGDDHPQYLLGDGTRALTADWDAGSYEIRAQTFESDIASGTAPLTIISSTRVDNLNVQYLSGKQDSDFANSSHAHNHNDTTNIQGGVSEERFHLTSGQAIIVTQPATVSQDGYLTSDAWAIFNNKQSQISSGNLIASSPLQIDNGINAIIGANRTVSVQDASISQKGATQLSNSYSGTSQILSVTEKALSDGLGTKQNTLTNPITGTGTSGQLAQFTGSNSIVGVSASGIDATAIHNNVSGELSAIANKVTPAVSDIIIIEDSEDSFKKKNVLMSSIKFSDMDTNALHKAGAGEIQTITEKTSLSSGDLLVIEDSGDLYNKKRVQIANIPGGVDSTAIHKATASEISAITNKDTPVAADMLLIEDSADGNKKKMITISGLPAVADTTAIHKAIAGEIAAITAKTPVVDADFLLIEDSADTNKKKSATRGALLAGPIINTSTTDSTTTITGAIRTAGGLGVAKNLNVGGPMFSVNGNIPRFMSGLTISHYIGTILVNAGACSSKSGNYVLKLTSNIYKVLQNSGDWSAGSTGNGYLDNAPLAIDWYHAFLLLLSDGTYDVGFDTSLTPSNPAGAGNPTIVAYRYIGSFKNTSTNTTAAIVPFYQVGDNFYLYMQIKDFVGTMPSSVQTITLGYIPTEVYCEVTFCTYSSNDTGTNYLYFYNPSLPDPTINGNLYIHGDAISTLQLRIPTNSSAQIKTRSNTTINTLEIRVDGWRDLNLYMDAGSLT